MAGLMQELFDVLEEEIVVLKELLVFADEKIEILTKQEVARLEAVIGKESGLCKRLNGLEEQQKEIMGHLAVVLNQHANGLFTLEALASHLSDSDGGQQLENILSTYYEHLLELKKKNGMIRALLQKGSDYVEFSLNIIKGSIQNRPSVYDGKGEELQIKPNFFDFKQ